MARFCNGHGLVIKDADIEVIKVYYQSLFENFFIRRIQWFCFWIYRSLRFLAKPLDFVLWLIGSLRNLYVSQIPFFSYLPLLCVFPDFDVLIDGVSKD